MRQLLTFIALLAIAAGALYYSLSPQYPIRQGLDLQGGMRVSLEPDRAKLAQGQKINAEVMEQVRGVIENRVNSFGLSGADVRVKGSDQVLVQLPGAKDPQEALITLTNVAQLELRHFVNVRGTRNMSARYEMNFTPSATPGEPDVYTFRDTATDKPAELKEVIQGAPLIVKGSDMQPTSRAQIDPGSAKPVVTFELKPDAARTFAEFTTRNNGEILAIILDDKVISAPTIESAITEGNGQISGSSTMQEARTLANLLNSGSLPIAMKVAETQVVGATLGQDSIDRSIKAGVAGLGLVLAFMLFYYWLPGFLACVALVVYSAITFSIFKGINGVTPPIVLDLPGITGFILSVGMAVDANILIFERLKEELRSGKSLHAAVDAGFSRAFSSILDSNVTTWIVCAILIYLGAPVIKGFAITLAIGVAVSMFTAITVTRTLLHLVMNTPLGQNPAAYALNVGWLNMIFPANRQGAILSVFAKRKIYLGFSVVTTVIALLFIAATPFGKGLQPGIDFTGGTTIEAALNSKISDRASEDKLKAEVEAALHERGIPESTVSIGRSEEDWTTATITAEDLTPTDQAAILKRLQSQRGFDANAYKVETTGTKVTANATFVNDVSQAEISKLLTDKAPDGSTLTLKNLNVVTQSVDHGGVNAVPVALVSSTNLKPDQLAAAKEALTKVGGGIVQPLYQESSIGPSVAKEVTLNGVFSVLVASVFIILYLAFRFAIGGFMNGVKFGTCAVIALVHDVILVIGLFALMGALAGWKVDTLFITACLTVMGFSVHDTIVVYDRIREHLQHRRKGESFIEISDRSITQTFDRSVNTSFTVLLVVAALVFFGGGSIRLFNIALLVGIAIGTYSSIFVASPLVVLWERAVAAKAGTTDNEISYRNPRPGLATAAAGGAGSTSRPAPRPVSRPVPTVERTSSEAAADGDEEADSRSKPTSGPRTVQPKRKRRL